MSGRFLRDNAFLVAAVALPVVIVGLFLLTTAIPRWTVPPPAYDLLLRTSEYEQPNSAVFVDFVVRGERLHASIRRVDPNSYAPLAKLWLFDHATMNAREITLDLPRELAPGESTRMVPIDALAGRRVVSEPRVSRWLRAAEPRASRHRPDRRLVRDETLRRVGLTGEPRPRHPGPNVRSPQLSVAAVRRLAD